MLGLLFSGQGAQKTGVTRDLYDQLPLYRRSLDHTAQLLQMDLPSLLFDDYYADKLAQTQYAQPAIVAMSWSLFQVIRIYLPKQTCGLGLSLGEYSALACSGYLELEEVLRVIKRRGELMQQASEQTPSQMVAIMKVDFATVHKTVQQATSLGAVGVANVNTPSQIVVGGVPEAVDQVVEQLTTQNQARVVPLNVSGAFHTPVMQSIQVQLQQELQKIAWKQGNFPVYSTTTKRVFDPKTLTSNLTAQLVHTTYFADTLQQLAPLDKVIEVGPGKTLLGFTKKVLGKIPSYRLDSFDALQQTVSAMEAATNGFER
ncbi:ACP S-malonyltransferase [Bombilactobacillus folatiphilus]|uniref:Malonyl CoA-acyl carrier protein transacylase n=1 Tax=Bombilactobacillus folatiphilus TaxID=2923362 RepID=A0ABY4P8L3_9LACO|nr:ACP S-malonyltransferase [Bombilactobacillus folatiphilus]UQS82055.1 ACP S-malonyltransferase [Bombilactobacillus folatiphilus]